MNSYNSLAILCDTVHTFRLTNGPYRGTKGLFNCSSVIAPSQRISYLMIVVFKPKPFLSNLNLPITIDWMWTTKAGIEEARSKVQGPDSVWNEPRSRNWSISNFCRQENWRHASFEWLHFLLYCSLVFSNACMAFFSNGENGGIKIEEKTNEE